MPLGLSLCLPPLNGLFRVQLSPLFNEYGLKPYGMILDYLRFKQKQQMSRDI